MSTESSCLTYDHVDPIHMIKRIKKFPELWNPDDPHYRDKGRRRIAWTSICRAYFPDYEDMSVADQEEIGSYVTKKWRNIKDAYLKDLKYNVSKKGDMETRNKAKRRYKYAKLLSYLQPVFASTLNDISLMDESVIDSFNNTHEANSNEGSSDDGNDSDSEPDIIPLIPIGPTRAKRRRKVKTEASSPLEICSVTSLNEESTIMSESLSNAVEQNQDKLFFDSLLPMVSDFTDAERLEFRVDILTMIKKLKSKRPDT